MECLWVHIKTVALWPASSQTFFVCPQLQSVVDAIHNDASAGFSRAFKTRPHQIGGGPPKLSCTRCQSLDRAHQTRLIRRRQPFHPPDPIRKNKSQHLMQRLFVPSHTANQIGRV